MIRLVLLVILIVMLNATTSIIADDNAKAIALLKGVEQERLKYDCFHVCYEEYRAEEGITAEQIVDFDKGKIRKEHLPNASFQGMKSVLIEDIMYHMTSYDKGDVIIVPHRSTHARGADVYDPRSLGLTEMMSLSRDVSDNLLYKNRSNFSVSREELDGRSVYVVECHDGEDNGFAHWKLYIEEPGFLLIKHTMEDQNRNSMGIFLISESLKQSEKKRNSVFDVAQTLKCKQAFTTEQKSCCTIFEGTDPLRYHILALSSILHRK